MIERAATFRASAIVAVLAIGVVGVLIAGLQPQLLGMMATEGRLSAARLGVVATVELLAMGLGAGGAGAIVRVNWLCPAGAGAAIVLIIADAVTPLAAGGAIIAVRAAAGLAEGTLIWLAIGFIARTANPGRWAAIYLMAQTFAQLLIAALFAGSVLPRWGSAGGFALLAATGVIALAMLPWAPRAYARLEDDGVSGGRPPIAGMIALAGGMVQKLTRNSMASPEVLGVSSGAILGAMVMFFAVAAPSRIAQLAGSSIGAFLTLWLLAALPYPPLWPILAIAFASAHAGRHR